MRIAGDLVEPVEPDLSVEPASPFAFLATALGETRTQTFQVRNVGVGELSGEATLVAGSPSFTLAGETSYTALAPGDPPVEIDVVFQPTSAGAKSGQVRFSVSGGPGSEVVEVTGTRFSPEGTPRSRCASRPLPSARERERSSSPAPAARRALSRARG
jgi:hypothetical protein